MLDTTVIILIVSTTANLLVSLFGHIKKSSCFGVRVRTYNDRTRKPTKYTPINYQSKSDPPDEIIN